MTTGNPTPTKAITGGEFLIRDVSADEIFTPEEWTEEHRMMLQTGLDFVAQRIIPNLERIEALEEGLTPKLLEEVGELGLLGSSVPAELDGLGLDFKSTMLITESMGGAHSFAVSFSAHTGIARFPSCTTGTTPKKEVHPRPRHRSTQRMLLPHGTWKRVGRQQRQDHSQAQRGRHPLCPQWPKDVDHQRRICRRDDCVCQD